MTPNNTQLEPTETSPLLGKQDQNGPLIDSAISIAPVGPESCNKTDIDDEENVGDLEHQSSNGDNFKYQGLPEVKKRMKYIFPAIAIGVSNHQQHGSHTKAKRCRSSLLQQTKLS